MRRTFIALLLALGLPLVAALPGGAAPKGPGPNCAQIQKGNPVYSTALGTIPATFEVDVTLAAPSCSNIVYIATVYATSANGGRPIFAQSKSGDGTSSGLRFQFQVPGAPQNICGTVTSNSNDGRAFDQIPSLTENGCPIGGALILDGGSGGSTWQ
jgi:hypothetical protein